MNVNFPLFKGTCEGAGGNSVVIVMGTLKIVAIAAVVLLFIGIIFPEKKNAVITGAVLDATIFACPFPKR